MAITQIVPIFITLKGDGAATVFTFALANIYQVGFGGSMPSGNAGIVPSSVAINNPPVPVTSATVDANGNITITFTSAPAATTYVFELDLIFNSGAAVSTTPNPTENVTVFAGTTALAATGSSLNVNITGGSSGNAAASATGAAVPASADYQGVNVGGTLRGRTGVNPTGTVYAAQTDLTSANGVSLGSPSAYG